MIYTKIIFFFFSFVERKGRENIKSYEARGKYKEAQMIQEKIQKLAVI